MRYIGNKTKLLPFLRSAIARLGIAPGVAHDAFAGTAAVGRALKADGWTVHSSDLMTYSYVMQRAYVVASRVDDFDALAKADADVRRLFSRSREGDAIALSGARNGAHPAVADRGVSRMTAIADHLSTRVLAVDGFFARHFAASGGRMYFT